MNKDVIKIFDDIFDELDLKTQEGPKKEGKKEIGDFEDYFFINVIFDRLEEFQRQYGLIDKKLIDKTIDYGLDKYDCHLEKTTIQCKCGAKMYVKFISKNLSSSPFSYNDYCYDSNHYLIRCNYCDRKFIINSASEIIDVVEILSKKRLNDEIK
jgi:hypothetical protein